MSTGEDGADARHDPVIERSREVRLGLVMYGGVSLAIYINGVAHELFRAVRGRGTYRILKALTDSHVVVDALSGSSAGGINGILLAYALCNGCEFAPAARLWRRRGDIGALLRAVDDPSETYHSLLDSEGKYERWLHEAFDELKDNPVHGEKDAPSPCDELDLFVTGTDYHGRRWESSDDRGRAIQVKDHRTVFWLKHRKGRKEPLSPRAGDDDAPTQKAQPTHAALARLARITSCFPGAFAPVVVNGWDTVDRRLRRWGNVKSPGERVYIDGGVLDNKPFSTTLEAIYSRMSDRPVARWLLYVEPDPERFAAEPSHREIPNVIQTALNSVTAIPGYESIADDLRHLRKHNDRAEGLASLRKSASAGPAENPEQYRRARLVGLRNRVFASVFVRESDGDPSASARDAQTALRLWFDANVVRADGPLSQRCLSFDMDFRLRRLLYLTYEFEKVLVVKRDLLGVINRQIQVLEIVRHAMEATTEQIVNDVLRDARRQPPSPGEPPQPHDDAWAKKVWERIDRGLEQVARAVPPGSHQRRPTSSLRGLLDAAELSDLASRFRRLGGSSVRPDSTETLLESCDRFEAALLEDTPDLIQAYRGFDGIDSAAYPVEVLAGLRSYDVVKIARVSPCDAQTGLARRDMAKKVTGQRFAHFAAFLKRSWRSNDILWGRIDGACELVEVLLDAERVRHIFSDNTPARTVVEDLTAAVEALGDGACPLPGAREERTKLANWVQDLTSSDPAIRARAADLLARDGDGPKEWLVTLAQLEALAEDLGTVYEDAAAEQLDWNQYPDPQKTVAARVGKAEVRQADAAGTTFTPGKACLDPTTVEATSAVIASRAMSTLRAAGAPLENHFRSSYHVGEETTADIPPIVIIDWLTRGLIVAQKSLVLSLGPRADAVRSHPLYQAFLGWPLRAMAGVAGILRRSPGYIAGFSLAALAYIALSVVVFILWRDPVILSGGGLAMPGGVLFVILPMFLLLFLRGAASVKDGAGMVTWISRCLGWGIGLVAVLVALPALQRVFSGDAHHACLAVVPKRWVSHCEAPCEQIFVLGPWLVGALLVAGVVAVTSGFGGLIRWLRAGERRLAERKRRATSQPPTRAGA